MTAWDAFLKAIAKFQRLSLIAATFGAAGPFVATLLSISPPWPPGVEAMTIAVELLALAVAFWFIYRAPKRFASRFFLASVVLLSAVAIFYLFLNAYITFRIGGDGPRAVSGFTCLSVWQEKFADQCPFLSEQVLKGLEWRAESAWTQFSITTMRAVLATTWFAAFALLAASFGSFIVYQTGQEARAIDRRERAT